jgi:hypothetical protein
MTVSERNALASGSLGGAAELGTSPINKQSPKPLHDAQGAAEDDPDNSGSHSSDNVQRDVRETVSCLWPSCRYHRLPAHAANKLPFLLPFAKRGKSKPLTLPPHDTASACAALLLFRLQWMIMEFCEKGSLERAVSRGKFVRLHNRRPEMVRCLPANAGICAFIRQRRLANMCFA